MHRRAAGSRRVPAGLVALAVGGFGIGLTEFLIAGLLPQVASDFRVSEAAAGWLISGYALSVAIGAIVLTAATARLPRKRVLIGLVVLFVLGNLLSAVAPSYRVMLLGRIVAALCHGSFFGIGSLVARSLVAPDRGSRAVAVMFAGLTVANVLGVPFGALVGERWGWRAAFWAVTAIGVVALAGIAAYVPGGAAAGSGAGDRAPIRPAPARGLRVQVGAFSYIAYTLTEVGGFSSADVPWLLMVYGVGLVLGNLLGGRAADHDRDRALILALAGLTVTLTLFGLLAGSATASVLLMFLMGVFGFAAVPGMITRVTDHARGAVLAAGANVSASNLGNALGAWAGGVAITAGFGYTAPLYAGAAIALASVAVMAVAARRAGGGERGPARGEGPGPAGDDEHGPVVRR
ncbi:MFS transporter [Streptomyces griseorubiginosus]|uniref:MFS transporter n=1 Tax=Streptomyces griseorubiginosus TaxID=67304 RepID=UPI0033B41007